MRLAVKVIPRPLWFTSRRTVRVTMELEVPKRPIFKLTLSTAVVQRVLQWETQKRFFHYKYHGSMAKKCHFFFLSFFQTTCFIVTMNEGEKKRRRSNMKKNPKTALFGHIIKHQHIHFLVHRHFSWSTFGLHLG